MNIIISKLSLQDENAYGIMMQVYIMKAIDITPIYDKYKGLWVTLDKSYTTVISSDTTAKGAYEKAIKKGLEKPTLFKVPKQNLPFVGGNQQC